MPRGNGQGPNGMGAMTRRAAGFCTGRGLRRGPKSGTRFGEGRRCAPGLPTGTELKEEMNIEVAALERRISWLRGKIDAIDAESPAEDA